MVEVTGTAQKAAWVQKVLPPVEQVRPGLWSIPVPMPDSPLRYVLIYAFELPDGVAIVDAGWPTDEGWQALVAGLAQTGHAVTDVRAVLITHWHSDHHGLAGRVRAASGAWVGMHPLDAEMVKRRLDLQAVLDVSRAWIRARGGTAEDAAEIVGTIDDVRPMAALVDPDRMIDHGDRPLENRRGLRAVWTPGHTPGHLCFFDEDNDVLLSGDHILPRISPNITLHPGQAEDPLGDFLSSLSLAGELPAEEVLPAHEYRFAGLRARTDALREHHAVRLAEIEAALTATPGATTWELAQRLTWSRPWEALQGYIRQSAVGETLAHLTYLQKNGRVVRTGDAVDQWRLADG